jgi:hypothetical protein
LGTVYQLRKAYTRTRVTSSSGFIAAQAGLGYAQRWFVTEIEGIESMRVKNLFVCAVVFTAAQFTSSVAVAQAPARAHAKSDDHTNPRTARFGVWDNSTNPNNVMTYEAYDNGGSKLTVSNPSNPSHDWSYVTMFDGVFRPVAGQPGSETAVEIISPKSIRISNKRNGVVYQVVINTLSEDNNTINNEYIHLDKDGKITGVTHVTYNRRKK